MTHSLVLGTAGHIDHGKSALVKALTGTDPDRLKEEQERGITIDLGFAHTTIGDLDVSIVDVPGHERFVRTMLAGAGGVDAVLLVVAADESVKPQTREHLAICRLLGVPRGLIVVTKSDLVDADTAALVGLEVRALAAGTFLADAPIIAVSSKTGAGLDQLRDAIVALGEGPRASSRRGVVRLPVDRAFTIRGFGTVVTGTLGSGRVTREDELEVLPAGRRVRVRGVQVHGQRQDAADAARRVALNLAGVDVAEVHRGCTVATPQSLAVTRRADARIEIVSVPGAAGATAAPAVRHGMRVRVYQATTEVGARVSVAAVRPQKDAPWQRAKVGDAGVHVPTGAEAYVRLRFDSGVVLTRGDRIVVRAIAPPVTLGGGVILDPEPPAVGVRRESTLDRFVRLDADDNAAATSVAATWLAEAGERGLDASDLVRRGGLEPEVALRVVDEIVGSGVARRASGRVYDVAFAQRIESALVDALARAHRDDPEGDGISREALRDASGAPAAPALFADIVEGLERRGLVKGTDRLALTSHQPKRDDASALGARVEAVIREAGFTPPESAEIATAVSAPVQNVERLLASLSKEGRVIRAGSLHFHHATLERLKADVRAIPAPPGGGPRQIDVGDFKTRLGLSRKFAIPLLEWLDRERVTRRVGDKRVIL